MNPEFIINEELGKLISNVVKKFPSEKKDLLSLKVF